MRKKCQGDLKFGRKFAYTQQYSWGKSVKIYKGLKEYQSGGEKGYLVDTCLNAQDQYEVLVKNLID